MDSESKKLLKDTFALAEDNNSILRSMRRSQRISSIFRFIYWAVIIGSFVGAYYFIEPYLNQLMDVYGDAKSTIDSGVSNLKDVNGIVDKLKQQYKQ